MIPRRAVVSWIVYDLANTIFSMGVVSLLLGLYVSREVGAERADRLLGTITTISMGLIFFVSPLLGAMTDRAKRRMPFLVWSTLLCCVCTVLIARLPFAWSAALFIVGNAAYQAGLQFYDALLPEVTTEENRGRISGLGVGIGYVGSYFAIGIPLLLGTGDFAVLFTAVGAAFFVLSLPCFFFVRERGNPRPRPIIGWQAIRESTAETARTLREGHRYPGLLRFLVGRVFYTDAINTVIFFMSLYTTNVAMASGMDREAGERVAQFAMLFAVTFAIVGGIAWGWMVDRIGPKRTLTRVLWLWMAFFLFAASIGLFKWPVFTLYMLTVAGGIGLGGIWAADRPYMLRLTPPNRVGEFYGLYGMVGRFSAISGPLLWGATTYVVVERMGLEPLAGQSIAILTLFAMTAAGYLILRAVTDHPRDWAALTAPDLPAPAPRSYR